MADFNPPFAIDGERRSPNPTETELGFQCGAGQRELFNGMFHRIEAELSAIIAEAGITQTDEDLTQVLQAIQALIAAATGGGDTSQFLLMTQARARLPIFPDVLNADGRIGITAPVTGTVRLAGGVTFQHRGIFQVTTAQTDFPTDPSKTYHLRWDPTNGYRLRDLANVGYNPGALAESNQAFDSTYDDMLIGRVITNSSNVAAITQLANMSRLRTSATRAPSVADAGASGVVTPFTFNFARTPLAMLESTKPPGGGRDSDLWLEVSNLTRYGMSVRSWNWTADTNGDAGNHNSPGYTYNVVAF